ncbi:hypothetical protein MMC17_001701 [Xylographa soralifera]|nr:hypothetical protein [Xylographa soralifera]
MADRVLMHIISLQSVIREPLQSEFDKLTREVKSLTERSGSTFQAIMATTAIVESQKAIAQAETISKLTNLAFIFIPLTLSASIFGMNIVEWQNELYAWIWVVISLAIMLFTYVALYFDDIYVAMSRSLDYVQAVSVNSTANKISQASLFFVYYTKRAGRGLIAAVQLLTKEEGLVTLGIVMLIVGWALGLSAITTNIPLTYESRTDVGVGFGLGLPAMIMLWTIIWDEDQYAYPEVRKPGLTMLAILLTAIGVSIWAVLRYTPLAYNEKVSIVVGIAIGLPCLFTLWVGLVQKDIWHQPFLWTAALLAALAPSLWAIITKSPRDQYLNISLSVGLVGGLPCIIAIVFLFSTMKW